MWSRFKDWRSWLKGKKVKQPYFTLITRDRDSTDQLEVDSALIFLRALKLLKATQTGENSKQRYDATGDRTRDLSHRRPLTD